VSIPAELIPLHIQIDYKVGSPKTIPQDRQELRALTSHLVEFSMLPPTSSHIQSLELKSKIMELSKALNLKTPNYAHKVILANYEIHLTKSEISLLKLLPEGFSIADMASSKYLSRATIKSQLASIYRKLKVVNRVQAIKKARELGLIDGK
jgi:DNA-binding NarL/FixJ family response regulator